jgi:hypothetical protein
LAGIDHLVGRVSAKILNEKKKKGKNYLEEIFKEDLENDIAVIKILCYKKVNSLFQIRKDILTEDIEEVNNVFKEISEENKAVREQSQFEVDEYLRIHCAEELFECRHPDFPLELWKYLPTEEKRRNKMVYCEFSDERRKEILEQLSKMDICHESPRHILELPIFRAICYGRLRTFGHLSLDNPPTIKGSTMSIKLTDEIPVKAKQRPLSMMMRAFLIAKIRDMEKKGQVERSTSSYNSPPVLVSYPERIAAFMLKHGNDAAQRIFDLAFEHEVRILFRLTNDFRGVNAKTIPELFPMPKILILLDLCRGSDRYSSSDVEDAFFSIFLEESSRAYTAFQTPDDAVQYTVAAQGLKNSAVVFARVINESFKDLTGKYFFYQDDLLVYATGLWNHIDTLLRVFQRCEEKNMVLKISKTHLNYRNMKILGHILSPDGRTVDPGLVKDIHNLEAPKTLQGVQSLLGLIQVAREYIPNLSTIIAPIQELTKKKKNALDKVD